VAAVALALLAAACGGPPGQEGQGGDAVALGGTSAPFEGTAGAVASPGDGGGEEDGAGSAPAPAPGTPGANASDGGAEAAAFVPPPLSERLPDGRQTMAPAEAADAIGVDIPGIGVRSRLVRLGLDADRELEVPDDFDLAGWYTHGPAPAERGPVVIAGHVDSRRGPAVFHDLHRLEPGQPVHVHRADGLVATYVVDRVEQHPKDAFPTEDVYGNTAGEELRLITCGGAVDLRRRTHRDNIIVFATLASTGPAAGR
jgi:sortase (surface protein transpeptidase)